MRLRLAFYVLLLLAGVLLHLAGRSVGAQTPPPAAGARPLVYVVSIEGMIDLGQAPYLKRVLEEARTQRAAAVILDISTFGGRVDAAVQMRDALLDSEVRTIAFINKRAISAGALISLASHNIAMGTGGTIGAATPVQVSGGGGGAIPVEEKTVSYVRKEFRSTAEARKRPPLIAEAMVDADVQIANVVEKGKLLTLTTDEALRLKVADFRADTLQQVLERAGLAGAELRQTQPNWAENVVRILTQPLVASLLVTMAMLGIIIELRTPGFGVPGALGVASLGLVLWGHWLAQLAGMEEALLVLGGLLLLAIEVLVIPGFGIAGLLGIAALIAGLVMGMTGEGNTAQLLTLVAARLVFSVLVAIGLSLLALRMLTYMPGGRRLILQTELDAGHGWTSPPPEDSHWLGRQGVAHSVLRPSGIAEIEGHRLDVVSDGEMVDAGRPIEVIRVDGNRIVVRELQTMSYKPPSQGEQR
jgi:membrane-bound serine protease (ClpP class)